MFPEVQERYGDYHPPFDVTKIVVELIATVPPKYLAGLKTILLVDSASLSRRDRSRKGMVSTTRREF
jgi:hypothetical protein